MEIQIHGLDFIRKDQFHLIQSRKNSYPNYLESQVRQEILAFGEGSQPRGTMEFMVLRIHLGFLLQYAVPDSQWDLPPMECWIPVSLTPSTQTLVFGSDCPLLYE